MTTPQVMQASLGKIPKLKEINKREDYSPEKAQEEFFTIQVVTRCCRGVLKNEKEVNPHFDQMVRDGQPDNDRQRSIINALESLIPRMSEKPEVICLENCAILELKHLRLTLQYYK